MNDSRRLLRTTVSAYSHRLSRKRVRRVRKANRKMPDSYEMMTLPHLQSSKVSESFTGVTNSENKKEVRREKKDMWYGMSEYEREDSRVRE